MKGALMSVSDRLLLRKRAIIETMNDELKNIAQVEHSRHRNFDNFIVNILGLLRLIVIYVPNQINGKILKQIKNIAKI